MRIGATVYSLEAGSEGRGDVVARYTGSHALMKGMVQVKWEEGGTTWEYPDDLAEVTAVAPSVLEEEAE